MQKSHRLPLLFVSILEGGALMATELIGAKLVAPYYGTSLYVWATIFSVTLGGLALGYYLGGKYSQKPNPFKTLQKVLAIGLVFSFVMPFWSSFIMDLFLPLPLILATFISTTIFLLPVFISFGMVSPLVIELLNSISDNPGGNSGLVYGVSTLGGVVCTFLFGFNFIPYKGIMLSLIFVGCMMGLAFVTTTLLKTKDA